MPLATHLPELAPDEAEELLKNSGVEDKGLRHAAARAVPGNPLLLRLTADALRTDDPSLATDVKTAHANAQVDPTSARTYMTRRIVAHVADPKARPFVIAAMVSPILTRPILSKIMAIVGPKTEDGKMQDPARAEVLRVFRSFGAATWLGRISLDGKTITFNRDLRRLVETLVDAVENDKAQWRTLQAGLYDYHAERSTSLDRALTVYHAAVLGHGYKMPRGPRVVSQLRGIIDQLPGDLRDRLTGVDRATAAAASPPEASGAPTADVAATPSDRDWTLYLEGSGKQPGQGEKLVQDDLAEEALKLYRGRPTRVPGLPPTFVIQAFADLGSWRSRDIDLPALVREMTEKVAQDLKGLSPDALSRLYWITRFAMLANAGRLSLPHLDLLAKACEGLRGPGLTMLPALVAIVEAESGRHLLGDRLIKGIRGHEAEARIALAWCEPVAGEIQVGQIAVTQHDWLRRTSILPLINGKSLDWAQQALDALGGKPIAAVNQTFADMRRTVAYKWDGRDVAQAILLLRGQTVEILRPLRETLAALYAAQPEAVIESILRPTIQQMTIRPKELEESIFTERLQANPRAWLTGFVGFADRARLLRGLCERIVEAGLEPGPATKDAVRVAAAFIAWDRALCSGGSSEWSIK